MPQPIGPAGLHGANRLAAMRGADHLADQHCTGRPFAAEAKAE